MVEDGYLMYPTKDNGFDTLVAASVSSKKRQRVDTDDDDDVVAPANLKKSKVMQEDGQTAKPRSVHIPVDEHVPSSDKYRVYIDDEATIFDSNSPLLRGSALPNINSQQRSTRQILAITTTNSTESKSLIMIKYIILGLAGVEWATTARANFWEMGVLNQLSASSTPSSRTRMVVCGKTATISPNRENLISWN